MSLRNAAALMKDDDLRDLVIAAMAYQARAVVMEASTVTDHAVRLSLAEAVLLNPTMYADQFRRIIAVDTAVAVLGNTAADVSEMILLQKVDQVWTKFAKLVIKQPPV